jgi:hypothetical protein
MSDKIVIKKMLITHDDIIRIIPFVIFFFIAWGKVPDYYFLIAIALMLVYSRRAINRILDRKIQFVFDKNGIHDPINFKTYSINEIKDTEIDFGGSNKLKLSFKYNNSVVFINLDNHKVSSKEIENYFLSIDPTKIRDKDKELLEEINTITKRISEGDKVLQIFKRYRQINGWIMFLIFLGIIGLAVTLQVIYSFPYSFAFGWLLMWLTLFYYNKINESKLRSKELISRLTDDQFSKLLQFDLRISNARDKKVAIIAMSIITAFIFFASYSLSK